MIVTATAEGGSGGHPSGSPGEARGAGAPRAWAPPPRGSPGAPVPAGTPPGPSPAPFSLPPHPPGRQQVRPGCGRSPPKPALGKKSTLNHIKKGKKESTRRPPARRAALGGGGPGSPPRPRGLCTAPLTPPRGRTPGSAQREYATPPWSLPGGRGGTTHFYYFYFFNHSPFFFLSSGGLDGHGRGERRARVEDTHPWGCSGGSPAGWGYEGAPLDNHRGGFMHYSLS